MERDYKKIEEEVSKIYNELKSIAIDEQIGIIINTNKYEETSADNIYMIIVDKDCNDNYNTISKYRHKNEQRDFEIVELIQKDIPYIPIKERDYKKIEEEVSPLFDKLKYIAINEQIWITIDAGKYENFFPDDIYIIITDRSCNNNYNKVSRYKHEIGRCNFEIIELVPKEEAK